MDILIFIFEMIGTAAFAVSGAFSALKKDMDLLGTVTLGVTTAVGGGVIRDIILGILPPKTFRDPIYALVAILFSLIFFIPKIRKGLVYNKKLYDTVMFLMDSIGLAIFTVMGIAVAWEINPEYINIFLATFVGVVTGVGGGVLRDIFSGEIPVIFRKHIYASASIAGSVVSVIVWHFAGKLPAMLLGASVVFIIRCLSAKFRWNLPKNTESEIYLEK